MPYLHCIATKCSIVPSERFPWFFSSALPGRSSTISYRSLSNLPSHTSTLTRRFYSSNSSTSTPVLIAGIVLGILAMILGVWRLIWMRQQREELSSQAKFNTEPTYWVPASMPAPAYGYEMNSGRPVGVGPYAAPAEVHYKTRQENHWNDVNQLNRNGGSRSSRTGYPGVSRQMYDLPQGQGGRRDA